MPTIPPVNIQQILQMGTHTEKVQQTLQHLPSISSQQQNEERKIADELRRTEVQDSEELFPTNPADARGRRRKQLRIRRKAAPSGDEPPSSEDATVPLEAFPGRQIDLRV